MSLSPRMRLKRVATMTGLLNWNSTGTSQRRGGVHQFPARTPRWSATFCVLGSRRLQPHVQTQPGLHGELLHPAPRRRRTTPKAQHRRNPCPVVDAIDRACAAGSGGIPAQIDQGLTLSCQRLRQNCYNRAIMGADHEYEVSFWIYFTV